MNKVLLVGGAGYIGSALTKYLLSKNYKVKSLDALIYSHGYSVKKFEKNKNYEFVFGDIRDSKLVESSFEDVSDVVILVGLVGDPITKKYPKVAEEVNKISLKNFINRCYGKKLNKVIFISTCSNYGLLKNNEIADENHVLNPFSSYAKSNVEIEEYLISLKDKVDYSPTILRFATAFGLSYRMRFDLTVNQFTKEILDNKLLHIYDENTCDLIAMSMILRDLLK